MAHDESGSQRLTAASFGDALSVTDVDGDEVLAESWSRIVVPEHIKTRLLNHAILSIQLRSQRLTGIRLPMHGLSLLCGPPGVGKTTLARGLGSEVARLLGGRFGRVRLVDINVHVLSSEFLGRTQRNIVRLFQEELPSLAEEGPLVVVIDEIEGLGVARSQLSLDINPADVFRGTAALLTSLDWLAREAPGVVAVATTNIPQALDGALVSRADLVLELPMPTVDVIEDLLRDSIRALSERYPSCQNILCNGVAQRLAQLLEGLDGRQVRKFIVDTLARRTETSLAPDQLTAEMLIDVAAQTRRSRELRAVV